MEDSSQKARTNQNKLIYLYFYLLIQIIKSSTTAW